MNANNATDHNETAFSKPCTMTSTTACQSQKSRMAADPKGVLLLLTFVSYYSGLKVLNHEKVQWKHSLSIQVLSFTKTQEENGHSALSFVTIDSDGKERLPPRFPFVPERQSPVLLRLVMCWSQLQGSWDNVGPFHIYGSSREPWLAVRLWVWEERGSVDLWGYFLSDRYSDPF